MTKARGNPAICIRLDPTETARLRSAAADLGLCVSDVVRQAIRQALDELGEPVLDLGLDGQMEVGELIEKE